LAHLRDGELAAFLDGGLSSSERHRVEAHIDICDMCRAELVQVGRAVERPGKQGGGATGPLLRRWWIPAAAAAGIVAILIVPRFTTRPPATDGQTRAARVADGEGRRRIDVISPADDVTVPAAHMTFAWHAINADIYRIKLLTESGDSIWAKETTDTTVVVPATVSLSPGRAYFWKVDAVATGIVATMRPYRVQVSR
jgi:predicted anti-sigma-YlaC factor YlaD